VIQISHNGVTIVKRLPVDDHSTQGVWLAAKELARFWTKDKCSPIG
jgi:hypothetical protein